MMKVPNIKSAEGMYTPWTYWVASGPDGEADILDVIVEDPWKEVFATMALSETWWSVCKLPIGETGNHRI
jgi:hypothetical protein